MRPPVCGWRGWLEGTYSDVSGSATLGGLGSGRGRYVGELHRLAVPVLCPGEVVVGLALQHQAEVQGGGQQGLQGVGVVVSRPQVPLGHRNLHSRHRADTYQYAHNLKQTMTEHH